MFVLISVCDFRIECWAAIILDTCGKTNEKPHYILPCFIGPIKIYLRKLTNTLGKVLTAKALTPWPIYYISNLKHWPSAFSYKRQNIRPSKYRWPWYTQLVKIMKILNLQVLALIKRGIVECGNQKKVLLML